MTYLVLKSRFIVGLPSSVLGRPSGSINRKVAAAPTGGEGFGQGIDDGGDKLKFGGKGFAECRDIGIGP